MTLSEEVLDLEIHAIRNRWSKLCSDPKHPDAFEGSPLYRLVIHPDLFNAVADRALTKFGAAWVFVRLEVLCDETMEGWRVMHITQIPPIP